MITCLIGPNGRLGNQMFQYAAMVGIASKQGLEYGINHRWGDAKTWKEFPIDNSRVLMSIDKPFDLSAKPCTVEYPPYAEANNDFHFQERFFGCGDGVMLQGYFQTQRYFAHCQDLIRKEFTFKPEIVEEANKFLFNKSYRETVAIHFRRGDYLMLPHHGVCEPSYYDKAIHAHFADKQYNFIIITDDVPWAKTNIPVGENIYICQTGNQYIDMCIISLCNHAVIANSTFSWWGTWLNANPDKKVVAPSVWFRQHLALLDTRDIYCEGWKVI